MTNFKTAVLQIVRTIPAGEVRSYQQVATLAGYPRASRAVANLMSNNYDPTIPCHRVIRSNGQLGGYNRGGESIKKAILCAEGYSSVGGV